jgi:hypothetical protein
MKPRADAEQVNAAARRRRPADGADDAVIHARRNVQRHRVASVTARLSTARPAYVRVVLTRHRWVTGEGRQWLQRQRLLGALGVTPSTHVRQTNLTPNANAVPPRKNTTGTHAPREKRTIRLTENMAQRTQPFRPAE